MANVKQTENPSDLKRFETQVRVLKHMVANSPKSEVKHFPIHEISQHTGCDERDVLRSLYILEGHKFVTPLPPGDFTSNVWCLTEMGFSAIKRININNATLL